MPETLLVVVDVGVFPLKKLLDISVRARLLLASSFQEEDAAG